MDMSLGDFEMVECKNGHTVCRSHLTATHDQIVKYAADHNLEGEIPPGDIQGDELYNLIRSLHEENDEFEQYEFDDSFPVEFCPVCQLKNFENGKIIAYFKKMRSGVTLQTVEEEIRGKFSSYDEFANFVKKGN
jgi:hypothetical protein